VRLNHSDGKSLQVEISRDELCILVNALNETLNAIPDWEFQTRTGVEMDDFRRLIKELDAALATNGSGTDTP
jgi:hypothetical protein